jgi:hypothetical protein
VVPLKAIEKKGSRTTPEIFLAFFLVVASSQLCPQLRGKGIKKFILCKIFIKRG